MPRPATGSIRERKIANDEVAYYARFSDQHKQRQELALGHSPQWTRERADKQLAYIIGQVENGVWTPPAASAAREDEDDPLFHDYASLVYARLKPGLAENTRKDYLWRLQKHLLPYFKDLHLSEITKSEVDKFSAEKQSSGLSPSSINMFIRLLAQILDYAMDHDYVQANAARGRRRMAKVDPRARKAKATWLEYPQLMALLDAAELLETEARSDYRSFGRRAACGVLFYGGLRISELCALCWRDIDLERGLIRVDDSKTEAGIREVVACVPLLAELRAYKTRARDTRPNAFVFPTASGEQRDRNNFRQRILDPVLDRTAELLEQQDENPLPGRITSRSGRRTCITWWLEAGANPRWVMSQVGHEDAHLTLSVYAQVAQGPPDPRIVKLMKRPDHGLREVA